MNLDIVTSNRASLIRGSKLDMIQTSVYAGVAGTLLAPPP